MPTREQILREIAAKKAARKKRRAGMEFTSTSSFGPGGKRKKVSTKKKKKTKRKGVKGRIAAALDKLVRGSAVGKLKRKSAEYLKKHGH